MKITQIDPQWLFLCLWLISCCNLALNWWERVTYGSGIIQVQNNHCFFLQKYAHQILATGMHYQQWLDSREKSITLECKNYGRLMCLFYCHSDCPSLNLQYVQERSVGPWLRWLFTSSAKWGSIHQWAIWWELPLAVRNTAFFSI